MKAIFVQLFFPNKKIKGVFDFYLKKKTCLMGLFENCFMVSNKYLYLFEMVVRATPTYCFSCSLHTCCSTIDNSLSMSSATTSDLKLGPTRPVRHSEADGNDNADKPDGDSAQSDSEGPSNGWMMRVSNNVDNQVVLAEDTMYYPTAEEVHSKDEPLEHPSLSW